MINDNIKSYLKALLSDSKNSFKSFAHEEITVDGTVKSLTIPSGSLYARMVFQSSIATPAARYLQNKSVAVSTTVGLPLLDMTVFEIIDFSNLNGFQITQIAAGTHTLQVEYFR